MNSPYKFTDPLGLLSVNTGACGQWCPNSGGYVDGSAFRGRDATFDWIQDKQKEGAGPRAASPGEQENTNFPRENLQPAIVSYTESTGYWGHGEMGEPASNSGWHEVARIRLCPKGCAPFSINNNFVEANGDNGAQILLDENAAYALSRIASAASGRPVTIDPNTIFKVTLSKNGFTLSVSQSVKIELFSGAGIDVNAKVRSVSFSNSGEVLSVDANISQVPLSNKPTSQAIKNQLNSSLKNTFGDGKNKLGEIVNSLTQAIRQKTATIQVNITLTKN